MEDGTASRRFGDAHVSGRRVRWRLPFVLFALLALAVVLTACGGGSASSGGVAAIGSSGAAATTTTSSSADRAAALTKAAQCMRDHGVPSFPDPTTDSNGNVRLTGLRGFDRNDPAMRTAFTACRSMFQAARPQFSPAQQQQFQNALLAFAKCVRAHGYNMPDPTFGGTPGQGGGPVRRHQPQRPGLPEGAHGLPVGACRRVPGRPLRRRGLWRRRPWLRWRRGGVTPMSTSSPDLPFPDDAAPREGTPVPSDAPGWHDDGTTGDLGPPRRRPLVPLLAVTVLVAAVVAAIYLTRSSGSSSGAATVTRSVALVPITRRNLVETSSYDGTVDYANQRPVTAASTTSSAATAGSGAAGGTGSASSTSSAGSSSSSGIVTSVAAVGTILHRGGRLFAVDAQPTVLLYGTFPMYRTLHSGVPAGPDIQQLEANLKALGYAPSSLVVNETWDAATTTAVDAWEAALGLTQDGTVPQSRVVFAPHAVRISSASAVGDPASPGTTVVTISSLRRVATVSLSIADAAVVGVGDRVAVTLPSGTTVPGRVASVGTTATAAASSSGGGASNGGAVNQNGASSSTSGATIDVTILIPDVRALGNLATAPVTVAFAQQRARHVLAVPTTALLTLADGTFALELSDGAGATHLVRVKPGLFAAGGYVGVTGDVHAGERVVVPR